MGDHELPPMETVRYTIVMPLIPGFKGSVAKMCKDPANSINGFIRWQSMDTIYATRSTNIFYSLYCYLVYPIMILFF